MSITDTSSALETIFLNSGMVRRAAMPPQPITPHLTLLLIVVGLPARHSPGRFACLNGLRTIPAPPRQREDRKIEYRQIVSMEQKTAIVETPPALIDLARKEGGFFSGRRAGLCERRADEGGEAVALARRVLRRLVEPRQEFLRQQLIGRSPTAVFVVVDDGLSELVLPPGAWCGGSSSRRPARQSAGAPRSQPAGRAWCGCLTWSAPRP